MNDVPALFYEQLFHKLYRPTTSASRELSGILGQIAAEFVQKTAFRSVRLVDGRFNDLQYHCYCRRENGRPLAIENVSRKHDRYTMVAVSAENDEYSTDPAALKELSEVTRGKYIGVILLTSNISEELENSIGSIQCCSYLEVRAHVPNLVKKLVRKKTLHVAVFKHNSHRDETVNALLTLLKQEQFNSADVLNLSELGLHKIITDWRENASSMAGKVIWSEQQTTPDLGFTPCTEEERRSFELYCPRLKHMVMQPPPSSRLSSLFSYLRGAQSNVLILKSERGAIYCFLNTNNDRKTLFAFV